MKQNLPTYVIHYTKYENRKRLLNKILEKENFVNVNYIEKYDRENITYFDYYENFRANHLEYQRRQHFNFSPLFPLTPGEISFTLKQKQFLTDFVNSSYDFCFLLEDDVIVNENFIEQFDRYMSLIPNDFDVAFVGQGGNKRIPEEQRIDGIHWYLKEYPSDRCGDSIVFKKESARRILQHMDKFKICFPIDHEYAFWFRELNMKVYWLEPPLSVQGSQIGLFKSVQQEFNTNSHCEDKSMYVRKDLNTFLED